MKKRLQVLAIILALAALPAFGHRAKQDLTDEKVYELIVALVSGASEAEIESQTLPEGGIKTAVTVPCVKRLEDLIFDGLINYASRLEGDVGVAIEFGDREVTLVITQK